MPRPAAVRFYIDADLLGLAKVVCSIRADCTYPGDPGAVIKRRERPPCIITTPEAKDPDWIPRVGCASSEPALPTRDDPVDSLEGEAG